MGKNLMNKTQYLLFLLIMLSIACQIIPTPPPLKRTPFSYTTKSIIKPEQTEDKIGISTAPQTSSTSTITPGDLPAFPLVSNIPFSNIEKFTWNPPDQSVEGIKLPINIEQAINSAVVSGLTSQQRLFLETYGFVAIKSDETNFTSLQNRISNQYGQPYFLTSDSAYHALKLNYIELIRELEKEELQPRIIAILNATLDEVRSYSPIVAGTDLETDTQTALFFLEVSLKLFDPQYQPDISFTDQVNKQVDVIISGQDLKTIIDFPVSVEEYQEFIPKGYYKSDPKLKAYYHGLTWLNRAQFKLEVADSSINATRTPLIITLAIRRAKLQNKTVLDEWVEIQKILNFFFGSSYSSGPPEYSSVMDQIYGNGLTIIGLKDETSWLAFQSVSLNMLPSSDNTIISLLKKDDLQALNWTYFGFGHSLDTIITSELIDKPINHTKKTVQLPSGLEILALLESHPSAIDILSSNQISFREDFLSEHENLKEVIYSQKEESWLSDLHSAWLFSMTPLMSDKNKGYPAFMQTEAWEHKDLNSALGAWILLHYDGDPTRVQSIEQMTIKYPAPCYVEPNPEIFYRLSYIALAIADGLEKRLSNNENAQNDNMINQYIDNFSELGLRYQQLGDIAAKELTGMDLDENDYLLCLSPLYPLSTETLNNTQLNPDTKTIIATNAPGKDVLQMGIGNLDRIYVLIPFGEEIAISQGGIYSYYEFPWVKTESLSISEWKNILKFSHPERPDWTASFLFQNGYPIDILAFRIGYAYKITLSGNNLNLREEPSSISPLLIKLHPGEIVEIIDGPIETGDEIWWKFKVTSSENKFIQGWAIENQEYFERIW